MADGALRALYGQLHPGDTPLPAGLRALPPRTIAEDTGRPASSILELMNYLFSSGRVPGPIGNGIDQSQGTPPARLEAGDIALPREHDIALSKDYPASVHRLMSVRPRR
jgi:hypothetical protein